VDEPEPAHPDDEGSRLFTQSSKSSANNELDKKESSNGNTDSQHLSNSCDSKLEIESESVNASHLEDEEEGFGMGVSLV